MKAVYMINGEVGLRQEPMPLIQRDTDVLVRVSYASICGYDIMTMRGEAAQDPTGCIGHEASGVVEKVGKGVFEEDLQPGARVTMECYQHCMMCEMCRGGMEEYCLNPGGKANLMRECVVMDKSQIYALPENVSLKEGSLVEPLMMGMHAVEKCKLEAGKTLLILGGGAMGQIMLKLATLAPAAKIVVVEPEAEKRAMALAHGATGVIDPKGENLLTRVSELTEGLGFDAVIEASGSRRSANIAFQTLRRGGALVFFALYGMEFNLPLNLFQLYWKDASIHGVCVPANHFPKLLGLVPRLRLESVITGLYPFAEAKRAFGDKAAGGHCKVMLEFAGEGMGK